MKNRYQFLLVVLILHLPLFAYPILRLCSWLGLNIGLTIAIFLPLFFSQVIVRMYFRHANSGLVLWLRRGANLLLGISPLLLCILLAAEIPVALDLLSARSAAYFLIGLTLALTIYSVINAYSPSVVTVRLESKQLQSRVRFVQITDVHIGSRSSEFLTRVMDKVNSLNPDFLCITGDFIYARGITEEKFAALRTCPVPMYFSTGAVEER